MVLSIKFRHIKRLFISICAIFLISVLCRQLINYILPIKYYELIKKYSIEYNLDKTLVLSVINAESRFKKEVKSHKGAVGLMQIMPETGKWLAKKMDMDNIKEDDLYLPNINIDIGCFYLRYLIDKYQDETLALCAYNAGSTNVYKWLDNTKYAKDGNLHTIPFKETKKYIKKIETFKVGYSILLKINSILNR